MNLWISLLSPTKIRCMQVNTWAAYELDYIRRYDCRNCLGVTMNGSESHPFPVECSGMMVSLLLPVLTVKDDTISEYGDKLGVRGSDVTSQLFPFCDFGWFEDFFGDICEEWGWGEGGGRCD
jgi:hypothetical protein